MKCVICKHGETAPGHATVTLERENSVIVVKNVPAEVCQNCSEYYLDDLTTILLMAVAEKAFTRKSEVEVVHFAA